MKTAVFFHADNDGLMSAMVFKVAEQARHDFSDLHFFEVQYGTPGEKNSHGRNIENLCHEVINFGFEKIYVVDFSLPFEQYVFLAANEIEVITIDHHPSAIPQMDKALKALSTPPGEGYLKFHIDTSGPAGCELVFDYLNERFIKGQHFYIENWQVLVGLVGIRDSGKLWDEELPQEKELAVRAVHEELLSHFGDIYDSSNHFTDMTGIVDKAYGVMSEWVPMFHKVFLGHVCGNFRNVFNAQRIYWESCRKNAIDVNIDGIEVKAVFLGSYQNFSDVGTYISRHSGKPCLGAFISPNGFKLSIRSHESCEVPAIKVAEKFGGGGHQKAAGGMLFGPEDLHQIEGILNFPFNSLFNRCLAMAPRGEEVVYTGEQLEELARQYPEQDFFVVGR